MLLDRERNRYSGACRDCGQTVLPGEGYLYRHSGANLMRGMRVSRYSARRQAFVLRCPNCAAAKNPEEVITEATESYQPYATIGNSQPGWD